MALTTKKPMIQDSAAAPRKKLPHELTDEDFEKVTVTGRGAGPAAAPAQPVVEEKPKGVKMGNKRQISHTITAEDLAEADRWAKRLGLGRAGFINMAIAEKTARLRAEIEPK